MTELPQGTLTFFLTDLEGSTRAWDTEPGLMREAMTRHDAIVYGAVERSGGVMVETGREGDSVLAVFVRAKDAASCAIGVQRAFRAVAWPIPMRIRISLHTGEVELRGGHYFGPPLNRCARVLALCHGGQTVVTRATRELIAEDPPADVGLVDLGLHALKDLKRSEHVFQLTDAEHPDPFPPLRTRPEYKTNLPIVLTTFVGRRSELAELHELLRSSRLITLTGPGGAGKTRLAKQLALEAADDLPGGAWLVDLAPVHDGDLVARTVASVLDVEEQTGRKVIDTLIDRCAPARMLVVLDNCEHLLAECARLAETLLGRCPQLVIVATSREPLNVGGEHTWRIPPLVGDEAVRLFHDRARSRSSDAAWRSRYAGAIAAICRKLDGIPLAIELAAARTTVMTPDDIRQRLDLGLAVLTQGSRTAPLRQQTLEAAIDWSHELLGDRERVLLRRLSVFAGRFSLGATERVCALNDAAPDEIVDDLGRLVSKSLVQPVDDRFALLQTIRAYARAKLVASGEAALVAAAHAAYYRILASDRRPGDLAGWLDRMEDEHDDLREALRWCVENDPRAGVAIASALYEYLKLRGHALEGRSINDQLAERLDRGSPEWARARLDSGAFTYTAGRVESALARIGEGIAAARAAGDLSLLARGLTFQGAVAIAAGDAGTAQASLDEAIRIARSMENGTQEADALHHLGVLAGLRGELAASRRLLTESLDLRRRLGASEHSVTTLALLAASAIMAGDLIAARRDVRESLEIALALRDRRAAWSLDVLACVEALEGQGSRALRLAGAALSMFESTAQIPPPSWRRFTDPILGRARTALAAEADAAWRSGRALTFEEVLHEALEGSEVPAAVGSP